MKLYTVIYSPNSFMPEIMETTTSNTGVSLNKAKNEVRNYLISLRNTIDFYIEMSEK